MRPSPASVLIGSVLLAVVQTCTPASTAPPATTAPASTAPARAEALRVHVLRSIPHDPDAFTQGLLFFQGKLYESTGLYARSSVRRVDPETGRVEAQVPLEPSLFGEGLAQAGPRLFQITWQEGRALVWNAARLTKEREFTYTGEGWGLCYDGKRLIMSDGSDVLAFRDPETFAKTGQVAVRRDGQPVHKLNELECVDGLVYANIWQDDHIVRIDPASGRVTGWIDASGLLTPAEKVNADVLNGIAQVPGTRHLLITGKLWPRMFEVELVPAKG